MNQQEAADLQAQIMGACKQVQRENPSWLFGMCYSEVQRQHPDWFTDPETVRDGQDIAHEQALDEKRQVQNQRVQQRLQGVSGADSKVDPKDLKEMVTRADQALQQKIKDVISEIQKEAPGTSYQDAYRRAEMRYPGLFLPDDAADKAEEMNPKHPLMPDNKLANLAHGLMQNHPGTTFNDALGHLERTRPELFDVPASLAALRKQQSYA